MIKIDNNFISETSQKAKKADRRRMNYNFHPELNDPIQRMLNALEPETYIRPHKHINPDKVEIFFVLKGKMVVIEFDDKGNISDHFLLEPLKGRYGCEVAAGTWHSLISLESGSVAYEVKEGPFAPIAPENFAPWAPADGDVECQNYKESLLQQLNY